MADDIFEVGLLLDAGPAAPGVALAVNMFRSVLDIMKEARDEGRRFADETNRIRDSLRDVRSLSGGMGVSDEFLRGHLEFIKKTGMTATEAHDYSEQFLGEAEAYRGKVSPEEFDKLQILSAQYAVSVGGDVGTRAKLAGRILSLGPEGRTAEDIVAEEAEINRLTQLGSGRADLATKSILNASASMLAEEGRGSVGSFRNLAILGMGASRLGSEFTIDTTLEQFGKGVQGFGPEKWQQFVRGDTAGGGLGIKEGTKVEDAMRPMFTWMEGQLNQGRDLNAALQEQGLERVEMRRALIGMFGQRESMYRELEGRGGEIATPEFVKREVDKAYASKEGERRLTEAGVLATETEVGMRGETYANLQRKAYGQLLGEGVLGPEAAAENAFNELMARGVATTRQDILIEQRTRALAEEEYKEFMPEQRQTGLSRLYGFADKLTGSLLSPLLGREKAAENEAIREQYEQNISTFQGGFGFDLQSQINLARLSKELGADPNQMYRNQAGESLNLLGMQTELRQRGDMSEESIMSVLKEAVKNANAQMSRPLAVAQAPKE